MKEFLHSTNDLHDNYLDAYRKLVTDKANMKSLALGALRSIQKLPNMVKSFFRQPEFQYIAM